MKYIFVFIVLAFAGYMLWEKNWLGALGALAIGGFLVHTPKDLKNLDDNYFPKEED